MVKIWNTNRIQQQKVAPWKATFLEDVMAMEGREFAFSSLRPSNGDQKGLFCEPRARFCAFRSFWAELPNKSSNIAPRNAAIFNSDLATFTTDVRTDKTSEILSGCGYREIHDDNHEQTSGGGSLCEAVWWAQGSRRQWRIRGRAYVLAPDIDDDTSGAMLVRQALMSRMRVVGGEERYGNWSWGKELTACFGDLTSAQRGRFIAPPPGQSIDVPYDQEQLKVGQQIDDLHHPLARAHFRVVVIVPEEVDVLDMNTARRHFYQFDKKEGWSHQECWP